MNQFEEEDMWDREDLYEQSLEEAKESKLASESDLYEEEISEEEGWEEEIDEMFEDEEVDTLSFMDNARVRLEQARLYEMLIQHNLFDGVDAAPEAVDRVQGEIKSFIVERLEILLGMKAEREVEIHHHSVESQFNDVEVTALKMIAAKVTKGASSNAPTTEPEESELNTIKAAPKQVGLNTLGVKKPKPTPTPSKGSPLRAPKKVAKPTKKIKKRPVKKSTPLRAKPKESAVKKRKLNKEMKKVSSKGKSITDIAKKDIKYIESLNNMSLEEASAVVDQRHSKKRSPIPIDQGAVNGLYSNRMAMNETAQHYKTILSKAKEQE